MGRVNFTGIGEWMLVYNETKLYRDNQHDCEFAMVKDNYQARIYSPLAKDTNFDKQSRYYNGNGANGNGLTIENGMAKYTDAEGETVSFPIDDVTAGADYYEINYNEDPFHIESQYKPQRMPAGTQMVPRVFKTNVGDIFTTNTLKVETDEDTEELVMPVIGDLFTPGATGILEKTTAQAGAGKMLWQVAKVYTMPDHQRGVKLIRVQ